MRKFQITNGVYFLDCHEVGMRILCGCPMDSVKLLMRAGFIQRIEDEQWLWEAGLTPSSFRMSPSRMVLF